MATRTTDATVRTSCNALAALLLIVAVIALAFPVLEVEGINGTGGASACAQHDAPPGAIVSEAAETQPRGTATLLPPRLECAYPTGAGAGAIRTHALQTTAGLWVGAVVGLGAIALAVAANAPRRSARPEPSLTSGA